MRIKVLKEKLSLLLSFLLVFYNLLTPFSLVSISYAEEQTTEPTPTEAQQEPTPEPTTEPQAEPSPQPTAEPTATPLPTATPTPTMTPDEYDVWKIQKRIEDDLQEQREEEQKALKREQKRLEQMREDEWEGNEEDAEWLAAHGGDEDYYISGQWDEEQKKAQEQKQEANDLYSPPEDSLFTNDTHPKTCDPYDPDSSSEPFLESTESSSGNATSEDIDSTNVNNHNCVSIENDSYAAGTSGVNNQSDNDGPVAMQTGSSNAEGRIVNKGNTNVSEDSDNLGSAQSEANDSFAHNAEAENVNTEEDSENFAYGKESDSLTVENSNTAYVDNQMLVEGTSGANSLTDNDGDAKLTSGDIELIANLLNILNLNITGQDFLHLIVNIFDDLNGNLDLDDIAKVLGFSDDDDLEVIARNENTGEDSKNTATAEENKTLGVNNNNTAEVNNELNAKGTSGANDVSGNDGGAEVVTGRIKILANLLNFINANFSGEKWRFIMINVFGGLMGNIYLPSTDPYLEGDDSSAVAENTDPGEGSSNISSASSLETTSVSNTNDVELTNTVSAVGISGNNEQVGNDDGDGAHTMQTGGTDIAARILNFLDFNITGDNWVFLVVNVFGKWMGQIIGFGGSAPIDAPDAGTFAAFSTGSAADPNNVSAYNNQTGEDSINKASASSVSETNINNENKAKVSNEVNALGISGENKVNNNDAGTSLVTGWVEIDANLLNIINMNISGRNWLVVFLNVFGDFVGNLFFGRPPVPPIAETIAAVQNLPEELDANITTPLLGQPTPKDTSNNQAPEQSQEETDNPGSLLKPNSQVRQTNTDQALTFPAENSNSVVLAGNSVSLYSASYNNQEWSEYDGGFANEDLGETKVGFFEEKIAEIKYLIANFIYLLKTLIFGGYPPKSGEGG